MTCVQLDAIELDTNNSAEIEFAKWYPDNKHVTKHMILLGYHVIQYGIKEYITGLETSTCDEYKKRHAEELSNEKTKHAKTMKETVSMYEEMLKQIKDSINVAEIKSVLEKEYETRTSLAAIKATKEVEERYCDQLRVLTEDKNKYKALYEQFTTTFEKEMDNKTTLSVMKAQQETEEKFTKEMINLREDLSRYKALYEDTKKRFDTMCDGENAKHIDEMKKQIEGYEKEVCLLKKTNFAKGNKGEGIIVQLLKSCYPCFEYKDVSKDKHCGDIHMVNQSNEIIMIESKYKESITKQDVDKFINDMVHMTDLNKNVVCGVFVSIMTKNIPHIGEIKIDFLPSPKGTPIVFVGFECEADFEAWFKNIMMLAIELAKRHSSRDISDSEKITEYEDLLRKVSPLVEQIKCMKLTIEKLRNNYMSTVNSTIMDLDSNARKLFDNICDILNTHSDMVVQPEEQFRCHVCEATFASKRGLNGHMKAHKP